MSTLALLLTALVSALALIGLGGGLYEVRVVDPVWPRRPEIVQPDRGGLSRRRFWIPAHLAFELALIAALVVAWSLPTVRAWLLAGLVSHAIMRIWSVFDFIPRALAFERAEPATIAEGAARRWTRRSRWRLPLDVITCATTLAAFAAAARLA